MKITLRLITSLIIVAASVAGFFSYLQVRSEKQRLTHELERRAMVVSDSLKESVVIFLKNNEEKN